MSDVVCTLVRLYTYLIIHIKHKMLHIKHISESLRALYLGDNDFEYLPREIGNLKNLQIVCIRLFILLFFSTYFMEDISFHVVYYLKSSVNEL